MLTQMSASVSKTERHGVPAEVEDDEVETPSKAPKTKSREVKFQDQSIKVTKSLKLKKSAEWLRQRDSSSEDELKGKHRLKGHKARIRGKMKVSGITKSVVHGTGGRTQNKVVLDKKRTSRPSARRSRRRRNIVDSSETDNSSDSSDLDISSESSESDLSEEDSEESESDNSIPRRTMRSHTSRTRRYDASDSRTNRGSRAKINRIPCPRKYDGSKDALAVLKTWVTTPVQGCTPRRVTLIQTRYSR
jgi:hypothetical protein